MASDGRAACECEPGHHAEGLTCVKDNTPPRNPCEPNPCVQPGRGQCSNVDGGAVCSCDPGKQEQGGVCVVPNPCEPNPCTAPNKTDCSVANGQPVCACVSGYVPEGDGCRPEQTVTCVGQHTTGDSFEPDECPGLARAVGAGGMQNEAHTLSPAGDEDWFKLTAVAGHIYEAVATGAAGQRLHLDLYAADGTTVLASDHGGQATVSLLHKAAGAGELFFRVRAFASGETGAYSISISDVGVDDFADEPALATTLTATSGTAVPGELQFDGDRDVVKLPLSAGRSYRFEAAWSATSTASLQLELIAPDRTTVVVSSQQVAPGALTRITSGGDYYLRIQEPTGKLRAAYTFTFTDLGVDDHGDAPPESSPVVIGAPPANGGFERPDDVDLFSFQAQAGHIYAFTCNPSGGAVDCQVSLSDAAGNVLASDNNGGTGYLVHEYAQAGTYYFRLSSGKVGTYTYRLEDLGFDDHGDTLATATPSTPAASPTPARLEVPGDVDFLKFSVEADTIYSFTCASNAFPCAVELQDATGTVLASGTASGSSVKLTHTFTAAGTLHARISSGTAGAMGSYTWLLESKHVDDHGNTLDAATPISAGGGTLSGSLEEATDVDVFRFTATAGHIYRFTCDSSVLDCDVELLDAGGAVLRSASGPETPAIITSEFNTGGAYYFRVRTDGSAVGAYSYTLEDLGVDDHGDASGQATSLTAPISGTGTLETAGDVDAFSFSGLAEEVYTFTCTGTSVDCNVLLLDSSGATVASDTSTSANASITYRLPRAGTWFLHVKSTATATGSYGYQLVGLGTDEHGDTTDTATPVVVGGPAAGGRIDTSTDVDLFSFSALAGHIYEITCTSTNLSCALELLSGTGTVLGSSSGANARVVYEVGPAGIYYFRIASASSSAGTYSYQIVDLGVDDHGDDLASATAITAGAPVANGTLELAGDVDVFSFSATAEHLYEFTCTGTTVDCNVELVHSTGTVLIADNSSRLTALVRLQLITAGTYYLRVKGGGSGSATGTYGYQLRDLGLDDHGDTTGTATPVTPGAPPRDGKMNSPTDVDVFSFEAVQGRIYQFTCAAAFDCNVVLRDGAGTVLASDSGPSANALVAFEFIAAGTYYFHVSSGSGALGTYTYELQDLGVDDHGDSRATATPIVPSATSSTGRAETLGDEDFFSFPGASNTTYEFTCSSSAIDCNVVLYDANGAVLQSDTRSSASARVSYVVRSAGTFFVKVSSGTPTLGDYTYQLRDLGPDDHGNTIDNATPVTPSSTFSNASIEVVSDVDMFSFTAVAGHIYDIECTTSAFDCNLVLMNAAGVTVASDTTSASNARVKVELATGGTYYFQIQSGSSAFGSYSYRLQDLGVDDHGDTDATATPITPMASTAPGQIETAGDFDVFSFSATAGRIYEFSCTGAAGDCDLALVDSSGTVLAQDVTPASSAKIVYELGTAGTYFVRLWFGNASTTVMGGYSYQLKDVGADDHGDSIATATLITPSTTSSTGRVETLGDVDFFRFAGVLNTTYEFSCSSSAIDCDVVLYDASGAVLQSDTGSSTSAKVTYLVRAAATYFIKVSSGTATVGDYTYQLKNLGTDDHGNTLADATPVTPSSTFANARMNAAADVDVFSFSAIAGHIYEVECSTSAFDCNLVLMDSTGATIASDTGTTLSAKVRRELATAGTYCFQIQSGSSAFGNYSYRVQDLGMDDHGDTDATATPITPMASTAPGQIETAGDFDVFSFSATAGRIYEFSCTGAAGDCDLTLVDSSGTVVVQDVGSSLSAKIVAELGTAGTYYVRLRFGTASTTVTGSYSYQLKDVGVDDHGDSIATATPITPSTTSTTGRIETLGDLDHFSFSGALSTTYEFSCSSSVIDCNVVLYDASGTVVQSDTSSNAGAKVTYLVRVAGTFYVRVYSGTATIGDYTYQLKNLGTDDHGNTLADATPVTPSSTFSNGRIDSSADVDMFSFNAGAGHIYEVECTTSAFDCDLVLMDSTGTTIASDTASTTSARVRVELNTGGTYYFRIQPGTTTFGAYTYRVRDLGVDDHGDTLATATPIMPSTTQTSATFEVAGDVDWFSFTAEAGRIYEFTCSTGGNINCNVYLTDAAGTTLASDTATLTTARVRYEYNTAGTYYVRVVAADWSTTNTYSFQLQLLGVDDHADTLAGATPIVPSATLTDATFEVPGDVDWFSFNAEAGHIYEFYCTTGGYINCNVYLTDAAGTTVVADTSTNTFARVRYEFNAAGTYYLRVVAADWEATNTYRYQLTDLGVDDHADTLAGATPIVPSTALTDATFEVAGDVDWFSFNAEAGHIYEFYCTTGGSIKRWEFSAAGTYYLRVVAADWNSTNTYQYQLEDLGVDDHADTLAGATPIVPSTALTAATFEVSGDVDWFSFSAEADHVYEFYCNSSTINCNVYLTDAAGTTVVSDTTTNTSARVRWEFNAAGTYSVRVVAADWSRTNTYQYQLADLGVDDHADTQAGATPIVPSTTQAPAKFEVSGDVDWFSFNAEAGHLYEFYCNSSIINCNVYLTDAAGTTLASDTLSNTSARARYLFATAGTYYARAVAANWSTSNTYSFQLLDLGTDDHSDTTTGATALTLGTAVSGSIEVVGDVDFFSMGLGSGTTYTVITTGISTTITVYAPDRTTVLSTGSSPRTFNAVSGGGTHYFRVQSASSTTGAYTVKVE
ncbi:pre-peptidase C-terminal domain-containing protein [Hyalangium gracile]|uniref:pre-peptidase C-terminal domain-containing protein n=1 Tax=Hyalangium gracile TaxID=394092 RepID=UPI001CCD6AC7|nr:pre-peptidase C-terminal domain-containing protein [Hyalangium gracile]